MEIQKFISIGQEIEAVFYSGDNIDEIVKFTEGSAVKNFNRKLCSQDQLILNNRIIDFQCFIFFDGEKFKAMKDRQFFKKFDLKLEAEDDEQN